MKKTKYIVKTTSQFKRDYKLAMKRHLKISDKNHDHALTGDWVGHRECHIQPNWLLIYRIEDDVLVLTLARTGSHSDLFNK